MIKRNLRLIADAQFGYFTAMQAKNAGYIYQHHGDFVSRGEWIRVDRGVFRLSDSPDTPESRFVRWSLWVKGRAADRLVVVSHQSALAHYGLAVDPSGITHLTICSDRFEKEEKPGCLLHRHELSPADYVSHGAYAITTPRRTLEDMKPDLVLYQQWAETVQLANQKRIISDEVAQELLGTALYQQAGSIPPLWSDPGVLRTGPTTPIGARREGFFTNRLDAGMREMTPTMRSTSDRSSWGKSHNRSFTLVEMLVVIAIISILASLLMPSLHNGLESARSVACASNLRQYSIGLNGYISQYSNWLPAGLAPATPAGSWADWTWSEAVLIGGQSDMVAFDKSVGRCPSTPVVSSYDEWATRHPAYPDFSTDYAANYAFFKNLTAITSVNRQYRATEVRSPSRIVAVGEMYFWGNLLGRGISLMFADKIPTSYAYTRVRYFLPYMTPTGDSMDPFGHGANHNGNGNASFFDGHVSSLSYEESTAKNTAGTFIHWQN